MTIELASSCPADTAARPDHPLIHRAIFGHAETSPTAVALRFRNQAISYAQLAATVDRYAADLQTLGVGPGVIVPVCLPRSPQLVGVLLAILRCGAAYAAFDPRWPDERHQSLVARLAPTVYVTDNGAGMRAVPGVTVWDPAAAGAVSAVFEPPTGTSPADPACVFFTSGTTGAPKGVVSTHQATTRLFGTDRLPGFRPGAVVPQSAPAPWDAFNLELWGTLVTGGTSVIVEDDYLLPGTLRDLVRGDGADCVFLTASLFNLFIDMDIDCFTGVRVLYTGGERLSVSHVRRFLDQHPDIQLFNAYGPVESCIFATAHEIRVADCELSDGIPIGVAVPDTQIFVLDGEVPANEGEICVGGPGLAIGYLGDPTQTAAKFVTVPLHGEPTRLYRTGDLGWFDDGGVLRFRGRADRQVKVRGYRIEPAEIETVVQRLDDIARAVVVPVPGVTTAFEHLALFYTAAGADQRSGEDPCGLTSRLYDLLPEYLVPDLVRHVDALPFTENGKLDTAALLALLA